LRLGGLTGGHSGDDINKRRGNAIKILTHLLLDASSLFGISVSRFEGGNLRNAIPREASADVVIHKNYLADFEMYCAGEAQLWKEALEATSPNIRFSVEPCPMPEYIVDIVTQSCLLNALTLCPSGVVSMSKTMPGLVSTSTNTASIKFKRKRDIVVATSQRSDSEAAKASIVARVHRVFESTGARVFSSDGYPGWTPDPQSPVAAITKAAYRRLFAGDPAVKAIHAGLECGLFLEKYPGLDMVSFGPTIRNVHSPSEQLHIPTVKRFADLLLAVLEDIPAKAR
jgi:dipeptidase D